VSNIKKHVAGSPQPILGDEDGEDRAAHLYSYRPLGEPIHLTTIFAADSGEALGRDDARPASLTILHLFPEV
jgi:hypothetical protein